MHDVFLVLFVLWAVGRFANQPSQRDPIGEVFKGLFALAAILAFLALAIGTTVLAGVYVSINEAGKDSTMQAWMSAGATAGAWAYLGAFFCRCGKKERAEALGYVAVLGVCAIGLVVAAHHTTSPQPVAFVPSLAPAQPAPQPYKVPLNEQYRLPSGSAY